MSNSHGNFVWYELATPDLAAATKFYKDVIGWGTQPFEGDDMAYTMWTAGETPIGGVMALPEEAKKTDPGAHWVAYVAVDDVDAMFKKAISLGGTSCVPPHDIPKVGRISVIADPHGAVIALITPDAPDMPRPTEVPERHVSWHELLAGEQESAFRFYSALFGWRKTDAVPTPNGVYQLYGKGEQTLGGMMTRPAGYGAPPHWLYYVKVNDLEATLERVKKAGGKVMMGPMEVPGGARIAQCSDPQGAAFALQSQ